MERKDEYHLVPANPDFHLIDIDQDGKESLDPIIAWRINRLPPTDRDQIPLMTSPVTLDGETDGAILCPGGYVIAPDFGYWPTLEAYLKVEQVLLRKHK